MKQVLNKIASLFLAVLMVVLILPLGNISVFAANVVDSTANPEELIGRGFNTIDGSYGGNEETMILADMWLVPEKTDVFTQGIYSTEGYSYSADTIEKMMEKFDSSVSLSSSVSLPIDILKLGMESKFSFSSGYSSSKAKSTSYFTTVVERVNKSYRLDTSRGNYVLSDVFIDHLDEIKNALGTNNEKDVIDSFFDQFGTHMLTEYRDGGRVQLSMTAWSEEIEDTWNQTIDESFPASVGIGDFSASSGIAAQQKWETMVASSEKSVYSKWSAAGGNGVDSFEDDSIRSWLASVDEKPTIIFETTKWIAVWNVIPYEEQYAGVRQALYNAYIEETSGRVEEFFGKYNDYKSQYSFSNILYTNKNGYVSVLDPSTEAIAVDYNSVISLTLSSEYDNANITYSIISLDGAAKEQIVCDKDGTVYIADKNGLAPQTAFTVNVYINGILTQYQEFRIEEEGSSLGLANGYGDKERPYLIENAADLQKLSGQTLTEQYMLVNNIDLGGLNWNPMRLEAEAVFDGNSYAVYNFTIDTIKENNVGFIYTNFGEVKNLQLGIVNEAYPADGSHYSFTVSKSITQVKWEIEKALLLGGIVGWNNNIVSNCKVVNGDIYGEIVLTQEGPFSGINSGVGNNLLEGYAYIGGLVGRNNNDGIIRGCSVEYSSVIGKITQNGGTGADGALYFGGIVGSSVTSATVENCISQNNILKILTQAFGWKVIGTSNSKTYANTNEASVNIGNIDGSISNCHYYNNRTTITRDTNSYGYNEGLGSFSGVGCTKHDAPLDEESIAKLNITNFTKLDLVLDSLKGTYIPNEQLKLAGLEVQTQDEIGWNKMDVKNYKVSGYDPNKLGKQTVIVIGYGGLTEIFEVETVKGTSVKFIEATTRKTDYFTGDEFDMNSVVLIAHLHDGTDEIVTSGFTVSGFSSANPGTCNIDIEYKGANCSLSVEIVEIKPVSLVIERLPDTTVYYTGQSFNDAGLVVNLLYNNGNVEDVTDDVVLTGYDNTASGVGEAQEITVTYGELNTVFTIAMRSNDVEKVSIHKAPEKTVYYVGDNMYAVDASGLELLVTYSSGENVVISYDKDKISLTAPDFSMAGKAEMTVNYSGQTTSYTIEIKAVELESISIEKEPQTALYAGDTLNLDGLAIRCQYNNGSERVVWYEKANPNFRILVDGYGYDEFPTFTSIGTKNVTIYYEENGIRVYTAYEITVKAVEINEIQISRYPSKTSYKTSDKFSTEGLEIRAIYNNGKTENISPENCTYVYDFSSVGSAIVTVWYNGRSATLSVNVQPPKYIEIASQPNRIDYEVGDTFDPAGLVVKAYYQDGTSAEITDYDIAAPIFNETGSKTVTISYQGRQATLVCNVSEKTIPEDAPQIVVESKTATIGQTVTVVISMKNNPGVAAMSFDISYDESKLELLSVTENDVLGGIVVPPESMSSPATVAWLSGAEDYTVSEIDMWTLTFRVKDSENSGATEITVSYEEGNITNQKGENVDFYVSNGTLNLVNHVPGDVNGDLATNMKDVVLLMQYVAKWDVSVNEASLDVNADGSVNMKDVVLLMQYVAKWDVIIY